MSLLDKNLSIHIRPEEWFRMAGYHVYRTDTSFQAYRVYPNHTVRVTFDPKYQEFKCHVFNKDHYLLMRHIYEDLAELIGDVEGYVGKF